MQVSLDGAIAQVQEAGRYMVEHDLTWGNAGNLSMRTGDDRYVITASGTRLGTLSAQDVIACAFVDGAIETDGRRPSKERPMHQAIYEMRPEINVVLHASPFYSTLIACTDVDIRSGWFVESMYYLERVARVRYCHPGSTELGEAVREQAAHANILLLDNHGVLVYDINLAEALMGLHTLEMTCRMWLTAQSAGVPMRPLPPTVVGDFLERAGYKPRREW
jgi:L-fuculose-phosphate aldolase